MQFDFLESEHELFVHEVGSTTLFDFVVTGVDILREFASSP